MGTGTHGQSLETTIAQVVADDLGVDVDDVTVIQGDTASTPFGPGTGGSRSAVILSGAADSAAARVRDQGRSRSPPTCSRRRADDLEIVDGRISVRGTPDQGDVAHRGRPRSPTSTRPALPPGMELGLEATAALHAAAPFTWSNACHACTVEVDPRTGVVTHPALRRQRGLRRDDQPDDRRGPDRRRRRAGHRRRALRALGLRRRRQPADRPRSSTTCCRPRPRCRSSSTATSRRRRRPTPAAQGHGRGRRDRLAAGGHQRGRRRPRPPRRPPHPPAADADGDRWRRSMHARTDAGAR